MADEAYRLSFFTDKKHSRIEREKQLSVQAGEIVGKLHAQLSAQYKNIETDEREQYSLNVLVVRLVFLLYAEDAGLLQHKDAFLDYMKQFESSQMRTALTELFEVLDTPVDQRDPYLSEDLLAFPYINGGLYSKNADIVIPQFTDQIRLDLLLEASQKFNWSKISPTIFGAVFESTLNPETRRAGGMHYTSIENIHKVIDPLFLNDLTQELEGIEGERVEKKRKVMLQAFQRKLASLNIFDPACGSGNFLTESYLSLRNLENRVIESLQGDQVSFDVDTESLIRVSISQFYGIEINDFAVSVAKTALWIAEEQMMEATQEIVLAPFDFLPLKSNSNIHEGNALRMDWNDVLPAEKCSFICGNPPFYGSSMCSSTQKKEIVDLFGKEVKRSSSIDYVSGWFYVASEYMTHSDISRAAFVSTNSITIGEQVFPVWNTLFRRFDISIDFAWRSFIWKNEASNQAHVHVVVIGFSPRSRQQKDKYIFDSNSKALLAQNVSPYLCDAPNIIVESRASQISNAKKITKGCQPTDGGNYIFTQKEKDDFVHQEPLAEKYFHLFLGSSELLKNKKRYCLYLGRTDLSDIEAMPLVLERVEAVRNMRLKSSAAPTRKMADKPLNFFFEAIPSSTYIVIPEVSSERRAYIPIAILSPEIMVSNKLWVMMDAGLYEFGILSSQIHNAWMRTVTGRLKSDYQYSGAVVYNNFVWPGAPKQESDEPKEALVESRVRAMIEAAAQGVLDAREAHPGKSLAHLYDPDKMPADLLAAHKALDAAVEEAYGVDFDGDEEKIVAHLFKLYAQATAAESNSKK